MKPNQMNKRQEAKAGTLAHACHSSIQEAETSVFSTVVQGEPGQTLSLKKKDWGWVSGKALV